MTSIGFIGLGNMGNPMADRLASAGFSLHVHDQNAGVVQRLVDSHPGISALGEKDWVNLDVLITMLPTSAIVESVLMEGGAAEKLPTNALIIDMSSSEPLRSRTLAATLTEKSLRYLDAPVSGGVRGAVNGALAIMVGGDAADLEEARPIFDRLGRSVIHVGQHGAGHAAKALNNLVSAATVAVTAEAMKTARAFGIDEQVFIDVLNASSGRSNTSENKASQFMLSGTFASGFPIGLMSKDVDIAVALADQLGIDAELSRETAELWKRVANAGHVGDDHTKMYEFLGTSLVEETQNAVKERMLDA